MINFIELRRAMMVIANTIDKLPRSRELSTTKTTAQKAMMWCGTYALHAKLGDNPYAKHDGKRETIDDIAPMFDATSDVLAKSILEKGLIYTVDQMREYLAKQIDALMGYMTDKDKLHMQEMSMSPTEIIHTNMCLFNVYTNLTETRMWLGMELGRIREEGIVSETII